MVSELPPISLLLQLGNPNLFVPCGSLWRRYYNHLNPVINKGPWTMEEDQIIIVRQIEFPNKWANIAREVSGRCVLLCDPRCSVA